MQYIGKQEQQTRVINLCLFLILHFLENLAKNIAYYIKPSKADIIWTLMKVHRFTVHPLVYVVTNTIYMLTEHHVLHVHNYTTENKVNINQTQIAVSL